MRETRFNPDAVYVEIGPRRERMQVDMGNAAMGFAKYALTVIVMIVAVVYLAVSANTAKNHAISNLRDEIQQLDKDNAEMEKTLQNCYAELERLKDGRNITSKARQLGLRPPNETQTVRRIKLVRAGNGLRAEKPSLVGYNR